MSRKLRIGYLWLALVLTCPATQHLQAAWDPADLVDSSWDIFTSARAFMQQLGRFSSGKPVTLDFGDSNDFTLSMFDEAYNPIGFSGTYLADTRGITITQDQIDPAELDEYLEEIVDMIAFFAGLDAADYNITGFTNIVAALTIKPKNRTDRNTGDKSIDINFTARIVARVQGWYFDDDEGVWEDFDLPMALMLKGKTTKDLGDYAGSDWDVTERNREQLRASPLRYVSEQHVMTLDLDDKLAGDSPAAFYFEDDSGQGFSGTYTRKGNKITFYPDIFELINFIDDKIIEADDQDPDIFVAPGDIRILAYRCTAVIRENTDPDTIIANFKIIFRTGGFIFVGLDFSDFEVKGLYTFKGFGNPAP